MTNPICLRPYCILIVCFPRGFLSEAKTNLSLKVKDVDSLDRAGVNIREWTKKEITVWLTEHELYT